MSKNRKAAYYTEQISCCITPSQEAAILDALAPGQSKSAYARSCIDLDRILSRYDDTKERRSAAILAVSSREFDEAILGIRSLLKYRTITNLPHAESYEKLLYCCAKISHYLTEICDDFRDKKALNKRHVFAEIMQEEGELKSITLSFKISKEMRLALKKKATGDESIHDICRLMLCPYGMIQPTDSRTLNLVSKWSVFYGSRIASLSRQIDTNLAEICAFDNEATHAASISILSDLSDLLFLINQSLNTDLIDRIKETKKKSKKAKN